MFAGKTDAKESSEKRTPHVTTLRVFKLCCSGSRRTQVPLRRNLLHIPHKTVESDWLSASVMSVKFWLAHN